MPKTIATSEPPPPEPPQHLSPRSQALWRALIHKARLPGRQALLQSGLEALDRCDEARAVIAASGLTATTATTKAVHIHPAVRVERESRAAFVEIWRTLSFQSAYEPEKDLSLS